MVKINEIASVVQHPSMARFGEYNRVVQGTEDDMDDMIAFIMDDKNSTERRLGVLRKLDVLLGTPQDSYDVSDLEEFMRDKVDETATDTEELPTGEYEMCELCQGEGCEHCEGGFHDVTGLHKIPDFKGLDIPE